MIETDSERETEEPAPRTQGTAPSAEPPQRSAAEGNGQAAGPLRRLGLWLFGLLTGASNNVIVGNFIGTDATGTTDVGNNAGIWAANNTNNVAPQKPLRP